MSEENDEMTAYGKPETEFAEIGHDGLLKKFKAWNKALDTRWSEWRDDAKLWYDMRAGRQWSEEQVESAEQLGLDNIVINKIDATISAVSGSEMTNRQDINYIPREMSTIGPDGRRQDAVVNEIFTAAAAWVRDESDAEDEESSAFQDVLVCGIGVIETRMDYEEDPDGMAVIQQCDPLEFAIDPSARRQNAVDAKYIRRQRPYTVEEAAQTFGVEMSSMGEMAAEQNRRHDNYPGSAYAGASGSQPSDTVVITEYQWFDTVKAHRVLNPTTGQLEILEHEEFERLVDRMPDIERMSATFRQRKYFRAFLCGDKILEAEPLPDEEFVYKFITGKYDRNTGTWYGLVKAMVDPQRLLNKQISQTQRIVDSNAKGGLLAEVDAFENPEQAEEDWAASDTIVWTKSGAVTGGKVVPKPLSQVPSGIDNLLQIANAAVPGVSGVNAEMLGVVDRDQPGILDMQRKEAAYGVLKVFFNGLRRYRKEHGRHLLKLISKYMTDERLIRVMGRNGNVQYLPLVRQSETMRYDVIVDETPTGPNQKDKVFAFMQSMMPLLRTMNLPPNMLLKFLEFSPLPSSLVQELTQMVEQMPPQSDPNAGKAQAEMQKAAMESQMKQQQAQQDAQLEVMKTQIKAQSDAKALEIKAAIEQQRAQEQVQLETWKAQQAQALATMQAEQAQALREQQFQFEASLKERQLEFEMKLATMELAMSAHAGNVGGSAVRLGGEPG